MAAPKASISTTPAIIAFAQTSALLPLTAHWNESFAESPKVRSVVEAEIPRIDDAERARFGLDIDEVVEGPLKASVSMVRRDEGVTTLRVAADLQQATVALPEIHWRKEPGTEGSPSLLVELGARSEEPRAGKGGVSKGSTRGSPVH